MKAGDTVQLRSGGPVMTVKEIEEKYVRVIWFATNTSESIVSETFMNETLKKVSFDADSNSYY